MLPEHQLDPGVIQLINMVHRWDDLWRKRFSRKWRNRFWLRLSDARQPNQPVRKEEHQREKQEQQQREYDRG